MTFEIEIACLVVVTFKDTFGPTDRMILIRCLTAGPCNNKFFYPWIYTSAGVVWAFVAVLESFNSVPPLPARTAPSLTRTASLGIGSLLCFRSIIAKLVE